MLRYWSSFQKFEDAGEAVIIYTSSPLVRKGTLVFYEDNKDNKKHVQKLAIHPDKLLFFCENIKKINGLFEVVFIHNKEKYYIEIHKKSKIPWVQVYPKILVALKVFGGLRLEDSLDPDMADVMAYMHH
jgi:hypothetical protein